MILGCHNNQNESSSETSSSNESDIIDSTTSAPNEMDTDLSQVGSSDFKSLFIESVGDTLPSSMVDKLSMTKTKILKGDVNELIENTPLKEEKCPSPKQINQLRDGTMLKYFKFNKNNSAGAKAFGFGGEIGKKELLIVHEFARYGSFPCDGKNEKYGIGLRCLIHIKSIKSKVNLDKLSTIAANVELGNIAASYALISLGFPMQGEDLANGTQPTGEYNIENYVKLTATFSKMMGQLNDDNKMIIAPISMNYYTP
ncbi:MULTISPECIES: hypothetical protein [Sphingobacterium]|uniref:hypothetical protein n=1 Tax=Sphingobacterium TaxID=28453 RepID=UPI0013D900B4|nr:MULTISPECIES: hypothetical protein [unclassified Sphingobacterium]